MYFRMHENSKLIFLKLAGIKIKQMKYKILFAAFILVVISAFTYKPNPKYDYLVTLTTEFGEIKIILFDDTPIHKKNFLENISKGYYFGSKFHRVINNFMIQGGEPKLKIYDDSATFENKTIPNEITVKHKHEYGALAAARTENPDKRSDRTQFYIVQNRYGAHHLDNAYTVFGKVVAGMDVVEKIATVPLNGSSPVKDVVFDITMQKVKKSEMIKFYGNIYQ